MQVPIIDISGFKSGTVSQRKAIADQVDRAATEVGFMQIVGHGIPAETLNGLKEAIDEFFALSPTEKALYRAPSPEINRGYSGPLSERLSYSLGVASAADLFEAFNVGASTATYPEFDLDSVNYADNIWPERPAGYREKVEAWFGEAGRLARELTRVFELALNLPEYFFAAYQTHSLDVMRMNLYSMPAGATRAENDQMGMGAHTDYGIVTVLWADAVTPGLQILDKAGVWHDVVPAPGALLVNLGDLLARWTNDRWISTMHRVLPPIDANGQVIRRRSTAFFHDGNVDAVVSCLPGCSDAEHPPLYAPVTIADHLAAKLGGSRALTLNEDAEREAARLKVGASA